MEQKGVITIEENGLTEFDCNAKMNIFKWWKRETPWEVFGMSVSIREQQRKLTENVICNSFLQLLKEKEFRQITVADVCRASGINRGTFYLHYRDINDLIDFINSWYVDAITPFIKSSYEAGMLPGMSEDFGVAELKLMEDILNILTSWPEYTQIILGEEKGQVVIERVTKMVEDTYTETLLRNNPEADVNEALYRLDFLFYGGWAVMQRWCKTGMKESAKQLIEYMKQI